MESYRGREERRIETVLNSLSEEDMEMARMLMDEGFRRISLLTHRVLKLKGNHMDDIFSWMNQEKLKNLGKLPYLGLGIRRTLDAGAINTKYGWIRRVLVFDYDGSGEVFSY
jgi:hypothetical protein